MSTKKLIQEALGDFGKERKPTYSAGFYNLCDVVLNDDEPKFLTFDKEITPETIIDDELFQPPPLSGWPPYLKIPRADKVLNYAQNHGESGDNGDLGACKGCTHLFYDLVKYHQEVSELPNEDLYYLLALWDIHTYFIEKANYSPIIYFYSVAERGKSRTLKGMTYVAFHGIRKGDIRDAQLIRDCTHLRATLAFDMTDFWEKVRLAGSQDVILNRYERGTTVSRVNRPEKGAFRDTDYYDVFGPTILATNEIISDIADTRSIPIVMRKADRDFDNDITPESGLDLKEQLTACRLVHFKDELPKVIRIAKSRLGDIVSPLHQILLKIVPKEEERFINLIKNIEKTRLTEKASTIDAEVVLAWVKAQDTVINGVVACQKVTEAFNQEREEKERILSRKIGARLSSFGFSKTQTNNHTLGFITDSKLTEKLTKEYGVHPLVDPESPDNPETKEDFVASVEKQLNEIL